MSIRQFSQMKSKTRSDLRDSEPVHDPLSVITQFPPELSSDLRVLCKELILSALLVQSWIE